MKEFKLQLIVLLQQVFLFLFLIQWPLSLPWWGYVAIVILTAPALLAVYVQRHQFRISPGPKPGARLLTYGPYRYIRHPMYFSLLTGPLVALLWDLEFWRVLTYVSLVLVVLFKVHEEEKLLKEKFPQYQEYRKRTQRFFPFIF